MYITSTRSYINTVEAAPSDTAEDKTGPIGEEGVVGMDIVKDKFVTNFFHNPISNFKSAL